MFQNTMSSKRVSHLLAGGAVSSLYKASLIHLTLRARSTPQKWPQARMHVKPLSSKLALQTFIYSRNPELQGQSMTNTEQKKMENGDNGGVGAELTACLQVTQWSIFPQHFLVSLHNLENKIFLPHVSQFHNKKKRNVQLYCKLGKEIFPFSSNLEAANKVLLPYPRYRKPSVLYQAGSSHENCLAIYGFSDS